ncbi:MAG: 50S ribosomal protein L1 [Fimbriimonadaceae bacterium]|nr:50S ribosomal protein L1 [Fimbriimonadaceae bacterium]QYK58292.1 MAG: 50S ribosomal protein L1 [Fimbriimonadaceae bacterium]
MRKNTKKTKHSTRFLSAVKEVEAEKQYEVSEAIGLVKKLASAKFVESVDMAIRLGVDPRKGDQNVRGTTNLPHGTGKTKKVAVLAKGDLAKEAEAAGADVVGDEDLIKRIQEGWKDFDVMIATNDMAPQIGKIGKFLGPRTPNKKNGTVTDAITQAVKEIKGATRVEYRVDKAGIVHVPIGKVNFSDDQLADNFKVALDAVIRAKPASAKGRYLVSLTLSSTMGPGFRLDTGLASKFSGH